MTDSLKRTFYIASSSSDENLPVVRALAAALQLMGMVWERDWTVPVETEPDPQHTIAPDRAVADIKAAKICSTFILLEPARTGAHIELGARFGVEKEAHIILCGQRPHFFYHHPLVKQHADEAAFLTWFKGPPAMPW